MKFTFVFEAAIAIASVNAASIGIPIDLPTGSALGSSDAPTQASSSAALDFIKCPDACLDVYSPVIGDDGISYPNECSMQMAKCKKSGKKDDWYASYKKLYGSRHSENDELLSALRGSKKNGETPGDVSTDV
ncbi:uncharacterized protein PITG_07094 [Phytophthora infestans T30-4]|uniref:Kazal-like domain-containing protein n=2 Tax=Phytophthora infestans TaxID=4787 RepID=D0N791_PHYIT|nr:uncharacterized protein PITG_07094 [Phytophthora infestans T30-4]KAF4039839.1 Kazal-type serine protease inhibitor domain [Phytophthora infestans]EEY53440.1 hypothetical protein PITG_07094 [Phytophthora infestans T30-4]KAF4042955.1 Kazal-type serine protease inhibitor domain [Phytophthora infestans]KAF4127412.1 Kazal-type serine protease inhibitor domain [Phytophthora infestans]KAI9998906.1 hypothetical protein PInf_003570 [Phytophthora infestans]|eukprot:XP_002905058.1 hypothetical protein PITG_07094 [Phytophthora infestans T30-4]